MKLVKGSRTTIRLTDESREKLMKLKDAGLDITLVVNALIELTDIDEIKRKTLEYIKIKTT